MVAITTAGTPTVISSGVNVSDVVKYVRNNINHSELSYNADKIKSRSTDVFNTFKGDDHWKKTLDRRQDQKSRGFFSRPDRRYKECGLVELETKELLISSLKNIGNEFPRQEKSSKLEVNAESGSKEPNTKQEAMYSKGKRYFLRRGADNGVLTIKRQLEKGDRRIVSIKAGQSLAAYVRQEEEDKKRVFYENEQKNKKLDLTMMDPFQKMPSVSNTLTSENTGNGTTESLQQKCRRTMNFLSKLDNLILLFTLTNNLKQRDLRTKTPLNVESLKILKKHPLPSELQPPPLIRPQHVENIPSSVGRYGRNSIMISAGGTLLPTEKQNIGNRLFLPGNVGESASKHTELSSPYNNGRKNRVVAVRHKNSPSSTPNGIKLETWDDLLAVETGASCRADSTTLDIENPTRGVSRISIHGQPKYNLKRRVPLWQTKCVTESLSPWMKVLQDQRDVKEKDIQCGRQKGNETKANRHDEIITSLKESFETTKNVFVQKVRDELENRINAYEKQFELMTCNGIRETDMKIMREKVSEWREHVNMSIARPPSWIEKLRFQQKSLRLLEDEETNKKFSSIMKFIETKSTLCLKAKICLLVFSLPVFELCSTEMIEALKFFIEDILEQKDNSLKEWLHTRKLFKIEAL